MSYASMHFTISFLPCSASACPVNQLIVFAFCTIIESIQLLNSLYYVIFLNKPMVIDSSKDDPKKVSVTAAKCLCV